MTWARKLFVVVVLALVAGPLVPVAAAAAPVAVVVIGPSAGAAAEAVDAEGGVVTAALPVVGGVAAQVSADDVDDLQARGLAVVDDAPARVTSGGFDAAAQVAALGLGELATPDAGAGVGVALVDTGVAEVEPLIDRVVAGPDLSGDDDGVDHYGHGTFMAGLITQAAPGAHIVSVKVAGADGETSLSTVLEAIGFVVEHREELAIRVLNLSIAVEAAPTWQIDPLALATSVAWSEGIAVVAAAGNEAAELTSPGATPAVITVGALDTNGTATRDDDTVAPWSGSGRVGPTVKPELLAPGVSVVSVRAPGSTIDSAHPEARVGDTGFRGSGTSMATALAAGAVAVLAAAHPDASPDELKAALMAGGSRVAGVPGVAVDVAGAEEAGPGPVAEFRPEPGTWGEETWTGVRWAGVRWAGVRWAGVRWAGVRWAGVRWAGVRWAGVRWADSEWAGVRWAGVRWADAEWAGVRWADSEWAGVRWAGVRWAGVRWAGVRWAGVRWAGVRWATATWVAEAA